MGWPLVNLPVLIGCAWPFDFDVGMRNSTLLVHRQNGEVRVWHESKVPLYVDVWPGTLSAPWSMMKLCAW